MPNILNLSEAGFKFMTQPSFDSFHALPYRDSGGIPTIGYGQEISELDMVKYKAGITEEFAKQLFDDYVNKLTVLLSKCPLAGFQQWQNDAILSFCYNIGYEDFVQSTPYKQLVTRNPDLGSWLWYVRDAKNHIDVGLVRRRRAEWKLFVYAIYS